MSGPPWRIAERWALLRNNCLLSWSVCAWLLTYVCAYFWIVHLTVSHPQTYVAGHGVSDCSRETLIPLKFMWQIKGRRWCNCECMHVTLLDGFGGHRVGRPGQFTSGIDNMINPLSQCSYFCWKFNHKMVHRLRTLLWMECHNRDHSKHVYSSILMYFHTFIWCKGMINIHAQNHIVGHYMFYYT